MFDASCIAIAASAYDVAPAAIEHVLRERVSAIGVMGIPEAWLPVLSKAGFDPGRLRSSPCYNIAAGAWIMAYEQGTGQKLPAWWVVPLSGTAPVSRPSILADSSWKACIQTAALRYHIPSTLLVGILKTEGGQVGQMHYNANGSYDMGPAQVNSIWLPQLQAAGFTRSDIINNSCINITVGAWILAQAMEGADPLEPADYWRHVGAYNSKTPEYNRRYAAKVWKNIADAASQPGSLP